MTTDPKEAGEILTGVYVSTDYTQADIADFLIDFAAAVRAEQREEDAAIGVHPDVEADGVVFCGKCGKAK